MSLKQSDKGDRRRKKISWFKLMGYVSEQLRINIKNYFKMEFEEERAGGGQAYDYLFAAHQSITGQNKDVCF